MNLTQARALVRLLEDEGDGAYATIKRPSDINSMSYDVEVSGARWELHETGEIEAYDQ